MAINGDDYLRRLRRFMTEQVLPVTSTVEREQGGADRWQPSARIEELKSAARAAGLWNLFLPDPRYGPGLSNRDYAMLAEEMGRVHWASEVFNCSAPDTGNMELLAKYGSDGQRARWLTPLLDGAIRSAYAMTEPEVACSDATNVALAIRRDADAWVLDGCKWWITGIGDPRCAVLLVFGRSGDDAQPRHRRHSVVIVPRDTPGIEVVRPLSTFGYDDAPHGHFEIRFRDVRVPLTNMVLGEGRGFEIAQGRLGPGRIHHCMRSIGAAERALELMCRRLQVRTAFGAALAHESVWQERVAEARCRIDMARMLTLHVADLIDRGGSKAAAKEVAMIKIVAPNVACQVIDWAIQAHGAAGVGDDFGLARMYAIQRSLRIADGPDEVHRRTVARQEFKSYLVEKRS